MAELQGFQKQYKDSETGCTTTDEAALQLCRQVYFLKQQNLQQQQDKNLQQENSELKTQVEEVRSELDALTSQSTINEYGNVAVFLLILIATILVTVILTKHMGKK